MNLHTLLAFLQSLYQTDLGYSALNSARSAISSVRTLSPGIHIDTTGNHPLMRIFMRRVFNLRPQLPPPSSVWILEVVLTFLKSWSPNATLSLPQLSMKLLMLMVLATGQRGQSMMHCCIKNMTVKHSRVYFHMRQLLKTSRPGAHVDKLIVCAYPVDRRLCPVLYIKEYLKRTKLLRQSDQFFVQCAKPYKDIPRDTVRRWTKQVLRLSGEDSVCFKAHSTRAAVSSLAEFRHVSMNTILKFVIWKSSSAMYFCTIL